MNHCGTFRYTIISRVSTRHYVLRLRCEVLCVLFLAQPKAPDYDKNDADDCSKYGVVNKNEE